MFGTIGFSYVGLVFLCCLFVPNIFYGLNLPSDHIKRKENKILLIFERTGQVLCTVFVVIFDNFNVDGINLWTVWLVMALICMILYLLCWGRYFRGSHISRDFYRPFLGIPLPLAVLPVAGVFLLSVYGKVLSLGIASLILGIGHIGITWQHWLAIKKSGKQRI